LCSSEEACEQLKKLFQMVQNTRKPENERQLNESSNRIKQEDEKSIRLKMPYDNVKLTYFRLNLVLLNRRNEASSTFYLFSRRVGNFPKLQTNPMEY
jgi:hypothetical protein